MGHIGIIAEYNPFHNGHAYQITQIKERFPDKCIISIISGDFVQRGEPAIFNKYLRTKCALAAGADIVFELPPLFATASAEHFASAAVLAAASTGVVDTLCFGAEDDNLPAFHAISQLLISEPDNYKQLLQTNLKSGMSYPKARSLAVSQYFEDPYYGELLQKPNNILGIEYIKAIHRYNLNICPVIIKRTGAGYHDDSLQHEICSATAIRNAFHTNGFTSSLKSNVPDPVFQILTEDSDAQPLFPEHFYSLLQYALWEHKGNYTPYPDINNEIANQLTALVSYPEDYDTLISQLTKKNVTASRIRHILLSILLGYSKTDLQTAQKEQYIRYLRLLGFQSNASSILKEMKQTASVPVINKVADASRQLSGKALAAFQKDLSVSDLYRQVFATVYHQTLPTEYEHSVIIR